VKSGHELCVFLRLFVQVSVCLEWARLREGPLDDVVLL